MVNEILHYVLNYAKEVLYTVPRQDQPRYKDKRDKLENASGKYTIQTFVLLFESKD